MFCFLIFGNFSAYAQNPPNANLLLNRYGEGNISTASDFIKETTTLSLNKENVVQDLEHRRTYVEGEVLISYKKEKVNLKTNGGKEKERLFLKGKGLKKKESIDSMNVSLLEISDEATVEETIEELKYESSIEYVQPNYQYYSTAINTNDTYKNYLWGLDNTGQVVRDTIGNSDKDIDAPEAWEIFDRNSNAVIVAVIDTGVEYSHPDLQNNMWDGTNCVSDTGNALGGCIHGYDYIDNDKSPRPDSIQEGDFSTPPHGTHIAGTISASKNNGRGVAGVAPEAEIMALKTNLTTAQIIKAINFAERNGAKIINASFTGSVNDSALLTAINNFSGLFIAAAGNGGSDSQGDNHDSGVHLYPCDYTSANIVCVAATDQIDVIASFSDYGITSVDLGAPGVNILSSSSYSIAYSEEFDDESEGAIPSDWIRGGVYDTWGVRTIDMVDPALSSTSIIPYPNNANSYLISNFINMNTEKGTFIFVTSCDTESYGWYDYATLSFSGNGYSFWENYRWNEYSIGSSQQVIIRNIDPTFLTSNFKFKLRWITDSYGNNYNGCFINAIFIIKEGQGSEGYEFMNGTSMAAPHVAGVAALVWGYRPDLSVGEVKSAILNSGDPVASLSGKTVTGKRVNAYNALVSVQGDVISSYKLTGNNCSISEKSKTISCRVPGDILKTNLTPTISLTGGSILPESGTPNNFYELNKYTLTKTDPSPAIEEYTVNIEDYFRTHTKFRSGVGNWGVANTRYTVSGDFNGDGTDEIAAMYDYGNEDMSIIVFNDQDQTYPTPWFRSGVGNWMVPVTKYLTAGDFNGDGTDEIAAMYDYGNEDMAMIVFTAEGDKFTPSIWFRSGVGNWLVPVTKYLTAGDYNGDGKDELAAMYDYGREDMAMIVFTPIGTTFTTSTWFRSGVGNWGVPYTKYLTAGDYNADGKDDIAAMYDYGNEDMAMIVFSPSGTTFTTSTWFRSGVGNWGVPYTKYLTAGDFNGNGIDQLAAMYDYGGEDMAMIMFSPSGTTFRTSTWFRSGVGNWGVPYTKHLSAGDYNGNGIDEVSSFYDYGLEDMAVILFR
ncbi:MAG: S8 family serine peptidase [Candidatus Dojkabacteria bacterium]|nr:S8 family serine peptidase [Candidatus Dojkabacteria bacterium]